MDCGRNRSTWRNPHRQKENISPAQSLGDWTGSQGFLFQAPVEEGLTPPPRNHAHFWTSDTTTDAPKKNNLPIGRLVRRSTSASILEVFSDRQKKINVLQTETRSGVTTSPSHLVGVVATLQRLLVHFGFSLSGFLIIVFKKQEKKLLLCVSINNLGLSIV